ncbi:MAG: hypothetical protein L3J76_04260 [Candidatus Hydrothermae bacterium]|nr:hypothetical protein [Candidatus Hydrothermae bacterium]
MQRWMVGLALSALLATACFKGEDVIKNLFPFQTDTDIATLNQLNFLQRLQQGEVILPVRVTGQSVDLQNVTVGVVNDQIRCKRASDGYTWNAFVDSAWTELDTLNGEVYVVAVAHSPDTLLPTMQTGDTLSGTVSIQSLDAGGNLDFEIVIP